MTVAMPAVRLPQSVSPLDNPGAVEPRPIKALTTELTAINPKENAYNTSVGYLRAFITLLVIGHHVALAYHPFAPPPASLTALPRWWQAFPVVDSQHWAGFALFTGFNDTFFMALMFFLSGLFVWNSLKHKQAGNFLRDRAIRLGVPFLAAAAVIAPLAYFPTYLQSVAAGGQMGFWRQWMSLGNWPAGPAWFVWVLLAFDAIAAALFLALPKWGDSLGKLTSGAYRRPIVFFGLMVILSAVAYIPMELVFNAFRWSAFGPFTIQTSRAFNYLFYFLMGAGVGSYGLNRGLLARDGNLARRWVLWSIGALIAFGIATGVGIGAMTAHAGSRGWEIASDSTFVLSCAALSFAFLSLFVRFVKRGNRIFDSLTSNAYGMYLIHYAFTSWMLYALLKISLPAAAKGSLAFAGVTLLTWGTTAALRRVPAIGRVI